MANNIKTLNKNIVVKFLENYGPNGYADICVLWLMRKHHLYFQPFSPDVVRCFLLAFCKRELSNKEVIKRIDLDLNDVSRHQQLIDKLWCEYGITEEYDDLWLGDAEEIQNILRHLKTKHNHIESNRRIGNSWKRVYTKILPSVINAKGKIFQEQFDLEVIINTLNNNLKELPNQKSKEQYIESLFEEYSNSLLNRILTPIDRQVIQKYNKLGENTSSLSVLDEMKKDYRLYHLLLRYGSISNFERRVGREHHASNELLCMMTTTKATSSASTQSDIILAQLAAIADPIAQLSKALNVLLTSNGILFGDLKEKLGINIDVKVTVNFPTTSLPESKHQDNKAIISPNGISLPDMLNTEKARLVFMKAYSKGWIISSEDGGVMWKGFGSRPNKAQLAYLCGKIYGYIHNDSGNAGEVVPWVQLEEFFKVSKLSFTLHQAYSAKKGKQPWMTVIDNIISEIE